MIIIKAVFFDLFFTLIYPRYTESENEYDVLSITKEEWEYYAENEVLYNERAIGKLKDESEIIEKIAAIMPFSVSEQQKSKILCLRQNRMKNALMSVHPCITDTLLSLRKKNIKLCLISNADKIDCKYFASSPLGEIFDEAVFSCDVGILKPDRKIYDLAMQKLNVMADESLFVGDGGSDEFIGAKRAGMQTVFTEYLIKKDKAERKKLYADCDYYIDDFKKLLDIVSK